MSGVIEQVLVRRFGPATAADYQGLAARVWNPHDEPRKCELIIGMDWIPQPRSKHYSLRDIYGDAFGGFLLQGSLKVSSLFHREIWALYRIEALQMRPEVQRALSHDPAVEYFMDASNVWYYGYKDGSLYCYDSENDELGSLGGIGSALDLLITQWLDVIPKR